MGSFIELNDTLQLTTAQGFPKELKLNMHLNKPYKATDFKGKVFVFKKKPNPRIYHPPPIRCFLVHNIDGKWLYWGHCLVIEQTISADKQGKNKFTSGKFIITKIYQPKYQRLITNNETGLGTGQSYFGG